MIQIPRDEFIAAIKEGIAATPRLSDAQCKALLRVAHEAATVGRCFSPCFEGDPCCPAAQAGIHPSEAVCACEFAYVYDAAIYETTLRTQGGFDAMNDEPARIV